jgi:N6-adenosine-specific RNA methylase IME4
MQYKRMKLNKKFDDQSKNKNRRIFLKELPFHFTFIFGSLIFLFFTNNLIFFSNQEPLKCWMFFGTMIT